MYNRVVDTLLAISQDWIQSFLLAIPIFLNGGNPYSVTHFWNPVWALFPLIPFEFAPLGRCLLFIVSVVAYMLIAKKLGARPVTMFAFLVSPLVFDALLWGNIEWLTLLGLAMSPLSGMWLLVLKPQMTIAPIAFILLFALRDRGWLASAKLITLPVVALVASFAVYGFWIVKLINYSSVTGQSLSFFPWSLVPGVVLFVLSLRRRDIRYSLAASPMFFPSISPQVWLVVPLAFVSSTRWSIVFLVASWVFVFLIR